jgi:hypothetical protein
LLYNTPPETSKRIREDRNWKTYIRYLNIKMIFICMSQYWMSYRKNQIYKSRNKHRF